MVCIASVPVWNASGEDQAVQLRERAGVRTEIIRLSDFLPPGAPENVQEAAAGIAMGRAPKLGSERSFSAEQVAQMLEGHGTLARQLEIPQKITGWRVGWAVSRQSVSETISDFLSQRPVHEGFKQNWREDLPQWAGQMSALSPSPTLEVVGTDWDAGQRATRFSLRCSDRTLCGSFLVNFPGEEFHAMATTHRNVANRILAKTPLIRPGDAAMLTLKNGAMRISLRVVCLQRGGLGETIRAREAKGHRVFRAQVIDEGRLSGSF